MSTRPRLVKNQNKADRPSADKLVRRLTSDHCCVPDCRKKPVSAHGLCLGHRDQIADAFKRFYVAAQNVVEDLVICDIESLPEAEIDNPFIRECDRFLDGAIRFWLEHHTDLRSIQTQTPKRSIGERARRKP
jgi:hypothetical protein